MKFKADAYPELNLFEILSSCEILATGWCVWVAESLNDPWSIRV